MRFKIPDPDYRWIVGLLGERVCKRFIYDRYVSDGFKVAFSYHGLGGINNRAKHQRVWFAFDNRTFRAFSKYIIKLDGRNDRNKGFLRYSVTYSFLKMLFRENVVSPLRNLSVSYRKFVGLLQDFDIHPDVVVFLQNGEVHLYEIKAKKSILSKRQKEFVKNCNKEAKMILLNPQFLFPKTVEIVEKKLGKIEDRK